MSSCVLVIHLVRTSLQGRWGAACCLLCAQPWCGDAQPLSNTRISHLSLFVRRLRKHAPATKSTPVKQLHRKGGNPEPPKEKERQRTPVVVKGCWMVLHADAQMNNEEGGVVCLSMRDVSWRSIGKRNDVTGKRRESIWKFCFVCQICQNRKIIHLLSYLLSAFKNVIFYFLSFVFRNKTQGNWTRRFSYSKSITLIISYRQNLIYSYRIRTRTQVVRPAMKEWISQRMIQVIVRSRRKNSIEYFPDRQSCCTHCRILYAVMLEVNRFLRFRVFWSLLPVGISYRAYINQSGLRIMTVAKRSSLVIKHCLSQLWFQSVSKWWKIPTIGGICFHLL
jgi:hypothetical protein